MIPPPLPPRPLVLGHRGASAEAPENTLTAFRLALAQGADGVELDVQRAADGTPVVIHDHTLERTTSGAGRVDARTPAELARLDAGDGRGVPTLAEAAAWAAESGAWLNVEIKAPGVEAASLAVLEGAGVLERVVFSSFHPAAVREVGRLAPGARRFLVTGEWNDRVLAGVEETGAGGVCLHDPLATPELLAGLAVRGLPVVVWTVDEPARLRALLDAGVAAVITNHPRRGAAARREVLG